MSSKRAVTLIPAQTITASGGSASDGFIEAFNEAIIFISVASIGGTTPSYTFKFQYSPDGSTWFDKSGAITAAITANGNYAIEIPNCGGAYSRIVWTVSGTNPTASVTIWVMGKKYDG